MDFTSSFKKKARKPKLSTQKKPTDNGDEEDDAIEDVNRDLEDDNRSIEVPMEIPRNLKITKEEMSLRKVLDQRRWHCMARPQYPSSCGISSLTSCWNYLFSTLGTGSLNPISTEEALEILGFKHPYKDVKFGSFTGNDTLIQWFGLLNRYYKVQGEARICFKLHGNSVTHGTDQEKALAELKEGLRSDQKSYIYHCFNHYMCPIGFEETPVMPHQAYSLRADICEWSDWIIVGEISKMYPVFHTVKWLDMVADIDCAFPKFFNIRNPKVGIQTKEHKCFNQGGSKFGGNLHCLIEFKKSSSTVAKEETEDEVRSAAAYLDSSVKDILIGAVTACAKAKPDDPRKFISDYLLNNKLN